MIRQTKIRGGTMEREMEEVEKAKIFESLKKFFISDMKIKETLLKLSPNEIDDWNEESRIEYTDKLYKGLEKLEIEFNTIVENFDFDSEISEAIKEHFDKARERFLIGDYNQGVCIGLYQEQFSHMSEKLIEEVKDKCAGYTYHDPNKLKQLINEAGSVNELLHVMHSYIVNNEEIIQDIPVIDTKDNDEGYPIILYGEETKLSKKIFDDFPLESDCGWTDIISMQDKILMMIRDKGHALTIDIDAADEKILVKYFIPKLCNRDMIKALPGVNNISDNGATGLFETSNEELTMKLFDFIDKVPTDLDIPVYKQASGNQREQQTVFTTEDAKEIAMEASGEGRKIGELNKLQKKMGEALKSERDDNFTEEKGEEVDDKTTRYE